MSHEEAGTTTRGTAVIQETGETASPRKAGRKGTRQKVKVIFQRQMKTANIDGRALNSSSFFRRRYHHPPFVITPPHRTCPYASLADPTRPETIP
ncbi:hypothetical protein L210DRAFT_3648847 [Boletus edulis BED1]|uniref:Uncharacterized protein n=1 Tax=Boletus edulis BED1 TaxID=1328754 RepID=A0AAD4BMV0_BOLED|nr:hypothetical protein L210DRAFT_3648847 [Boletus edulis BED1]